MVHKPSWNSNCQKYMAKWNHNTKFELAGLFGFFMLLCHSVSGDGKVIICNWFFGHGKPNKSRVLCKDRSIQGYKRGWSQYNAFTLYHPACFLLAIFPPFFFWSIRSTNESRRFSLETDIRVWKNAFRCFINNISKKQAEKNDSRQFVLFKIVIFYLFAFFIQTFYFILFLFLFSSFSGMHVRP